MKGTIFEFLELASRSPALSSELVALAAKFDFEFVDEELGDEDLEQVTGGTGATTSERLQQAMARRSRVVHTLSSILRRQSDAQSATTHNLK